MSWQYYNSTWYSHIWDRDHQTTTAAAVKGTTMTIWNLVMYSWKDLASYLCVKTWVQEKLKKWLFFPCNYLYVNGSIDVLSYMYMYLFRHIILTIYIILCVYVTISFKHAWGWFEFKLNISYFALLWRRSHLLMEK